MARLVSAGDYGSEGERRAAEVLKALPASWVVIANKLLVTRNGRSFELDFIVLGERWVFVIDEKSWRGRINGTDQVWVRADGSSERSPISKVDYVARVLKGELSGRVGHLRNVADHFVHGCVCLSAAEQLPQLQDPRAQSGVFLLSHIVESLVKFDGTGGSHVIGIVRDVLEQKLVDFGPRPKVPTKVGLYEISEARDLRPGVRLFTAQFPGEGERKLLVYEHAHDQDFFLREFRALRELRHTGVVAEVGEPFVWSENFLILPIFPAKGRSLSALPVSFERQGLMTELRTALGAFEALALIHERRVLHRAIDPDCIFVDQNGAAVKITFTDFHAARIGDQTIAPRLDEELELEPYVAPEIAAGFGFATEESDVFSLSLVLLERFADKPVADLRSGDQVQVSVAPAWDQLSDGLSATLCGFFEGVTSIGALAPTASPEATRPSAGTCVEFFRDLVNSLKIAKEVETGDALLDSRYRVERTLGEGSSAVTYLVKDTVIDGFFAVKRFKRASAVWEQARAEFQALRQIDSRLLPRVYDVYPPTSDIHLKMEYVPGTTLAELATTFPWPLDRWLDLARDLLGAVAVLEKRNILHRDVKPANVVLREDDGSPVLVDLGFATPADQFRTAAGTPKYLPPEALSAAQPPATSDLYALGVLFHEVLTGEAPSRAHIGEQPASFGPATSPRIRRVREFVLRLCDQDPRRRFQNVSEALAALDAALTAPDPPQVVEGLLELVNPWVEQVRGTYRHSSIGNADNRGLDTTFAHETYVPTALDEILLPAILVALPRIVFLSGNPGDGKTAFLEMLEAHLVREGARTVSKDESGWEIAHKGHLFRSCFDASEAHGELTADEQLDLKLLPFAGGRPADVAMTVVVAINDGRLSDFLARFQDKYSWVRGEAARASGGWIRKDPIWMIDLKRRSLAASSDGSPAVMSRLIDAFVAPDRWAICEGCISKTVCPMKQNASDLGSAQAGSGARARLEQLLRLAHLRMVRHITMRDLRSALSFLIVADTSCREVHAERRGEAPPGATRRWFWQTIFMSKADDPLEASIRGLDPGSAVTPHLDRFFALRRRPEHAAERASMFEDGQDVEPELFPTVREWLIALRRRLWFHGIADRPGGGPLPRWEVRQLLPYRYSEDFVAALSSEDVRSAQLPLLLRGITGSEGVIAVDASAGLSLKVSASDAERLLVIKRFPSERFRLTADLSPPSPVEIMPARLRLELLGGSVGVGISLDLYDLLRRIADGLRPDAEEFEPLLADLAPFKALLLLQESRELILVVNGRSSERIRLEAGKVARESVSAS